MFCCQSIYLRHTARVNALGAQAPTGAPAADGVPAPQEAPAADGAPAQPDAPAQPEVPVEAVGVEAPENEANNAAPVNAQQPNQRSDGKTGMENIKATTEQLRNEANIQRKKVSEVSKDLMEYCEKNKQGDTLVSGPVDAQNPFQEKKSCLLL